jgi:hypothetical protein
MSLFSFLGACGGFTMGGIPTGGRMSADLSPFLGTRKRDLFCNIGNGNGKIMNINTKLVSGNTMLHCCSAQRVPQKTGLRPTLICCKVRAPNFANLRVAKPNSFKKTIFH